MTIKPLLQWRASDQLIYIIRLRVLHLPRNPERPVVGREVPRLLRNVMFSEAEFVKVVKASGDTFVRQPAIELGDVGIPIMQDRGSDSGPGETMKVRQAPQPRRLDPGPQPLRTNRGSARVSNLPPDRTRPDSWPPQPSETFCG